MLDLTLEQIKENNSILNDDFNYYMNVNKDEVIYISYNDFGFIEKVITDLKDELCFTYDEFGRVIKEEISNEDKMLGTTDYEYEYADKQDLIITYSDGMYCGTVSYDNNGTVDYEVCRGYYAGNVTDELCDLMCGIENIDEYFEDEVFKNE